VTGAPRPLSVRTFYFLYFAALGVTLPYLPAYLAAAGIDPARIGTLLAISPAVMLVAPSWWGHWADRLGRPGRVLTVMACGACVSFLPLLWVRGVAPSALVLAAYAFFGSSITAIIDGLALRVVQHGGGTFARLRLWGSVGFIGASVAFGAAAHAGSAATVVAPVAFIAAYGVVSLTLDARSAPPPAEEAFAGLRLLGQRDLLLFLVAAALHWIACAPYNGMLALHVQALGLPLWVVGLSAGLGVVAEVAVMTWYPHLAARLAPRSVLALAFLGSAARWAGMALAQHAAPLIALNVLHGLTFGAFYVAGILFVGRRVPDALRSRGQALFVSFTFGIGGLIGFTGAGAGFERWGGHRLFAAAAAVEILAAGVVAFTRPERGTLQ
jgi:PPP family 3-phenylpropionic acid transporter